MQPANHSEPSLLLSMKEAASALCVSERTVWTLVHNGELPHMRLGRRLLFSRTALAAWIARMESKCVELAGALSPKTKPV
jgi:excisionase family DNA binding protein